MNRTYDGWGQTSIRETYPLINLDPNIKHSGNSSLRIDPLPVPPSPNYPVFVLPLATMLFPDTNYKLSAFAKIPANGSITIIAPSGGPLLPVGDPTPNGWQLYEGEFKTGPSVYRTTLSLLNNGAASVWFDDIKVEKLGCTPANKPLADFTNDCTVEYADLKVMAGHWLRDVCNTPDWCEGADFDHNGFVDFADFATFANYWLESAEP
jgi:hypothetical protein